ncbi:hypothetical protein GSI_05215 [Ganoderma sinense ZZ0214-1]|uniref:Uncharacterized protein n=1 Tax=Ganoderma sinense ZZ0214-1 TaxID=1077348 RepID=A0A2G8SFG7_9APHY|nr:hypothetical protein GSI_05215 [Ganoderma sinense ZZ0214-1]
MPNLTLAVAQYQIEGYNWPKVHVALVAFVPNHPQAHIFQLWGNTDTFAFRYSETDHFLKSSKIQGGVKIGEVAREAVRSGWLKQVLSERVVVRRRDPSYNCQVWLLDAVRELQQHRDKVLIVPEFNREWLFRALRRQHLTWEQANDHYFETVMPALRR